MRDACVCGRRKDPKSRGCGACYQAHRRRHMQTGQRQWQNQCRCGALKAKSATQCVGCRTRTGYNASEAYALALSVRQFSLDEVFARQHERVRVRCDDALERVYEARQGGWTRQFMRDTELEIRGSVSGYSNGAKCGAAQ